jgi:acyl-CoA synthetase (AMP-forming)/AMP-acid ligase II
MTGCHNVYRRFEAVAQGNSERYALAFRAGRGWSIWSYGDLVSRSGIIVDQLRQAGVGKGSAVGLVVHRYPETIATMIAVFAIGGHFVPLDPALPE